MSCDKEITGPGYASPLDAMNNGPREQLLYVVTVQPNLNEPHGDYLSTVDVDPNSPTYCQIIHRTFTNRTGNEIHHSGWNTCSSCHTKKCIKNNNNKNVIPQRNKLILPCINSDRILIFDIKENPKKPTLFKEINNDILKKYNLTAPHTTHCLANGNIMISTLGTSDGTAKCEFILFDSEFNCIGTWIKNNDENNSLKAYCGYDFWYQPYFDVMVSSEWGAPKLFRRGFQPNDLDDITQYGRRINVFKWSTQTLYQVIDLGEEGTAPLEIRFMHNPKQSQGFVGCCLYSNVFQFIKKDNSMEYYAKKIIDVPAKKIKNLNNGNIEIINGMMTDIILSLDDKFLYFSNWLHGDVRQYDISVPDKPKLTGQIFLGGKILNDLNIEIIEDLELKEQPKPCILKGKRLEGGPQMLQLSLDGKRLYASTSLFSPWDKQFYPEMVKVGGTIVQIDCNQNGGMKLNENFLVHFGENEPYGPSLPHEMRYPGGDCTSDIWLAQD